MRNSQPGLHDALFAVVRANVPHLRSTSNRAEDWLVSLLARRARQLAASGQCRDEIVARLVQELSSPSAAPAPEVRNSAFARIWGGIAAVLRR